MVAVYYFISIDKAVQWSLASLMCCRQHDRSTVRHRRHCRARLEEPSLPRARSVVPVEAELMHARPTVVLGKTHLNIASHLAGGHHVIKCQFVR